MKDDLMIAGYHVSTPSIDIHTIGAGGGTIAGVDAAGMLYVGPQGAGAHPGPACYGLGGTEPTVTDAQLVLGRLRPGRLRRPLVCLSTRTQPGRPSKRASPQPLGLSVEDAAAGIIARARAEPAARRRIHLDRAGHAPRRFTLVAAGGAGPMHGAECRAGARLPAGVRAPRCRRLCAIGMLHADVRQDFQMLLSKAQLDELEPGQIRRRAGQVGRPGPRGLAGRGFWPRPGRSRASDRPALPRPALVDSRSLGRRAGFDTAGDAARLRGRVSAPLRSHSARRRRSWLRRCGSPLALRRERPRPADRKRRSPQSHRQAGQLRDRSGTTSTAGSIPPSTMGPVWAGRPRFGARRRRGANDHGPAGPG